MLRINVVETNAETQLILEGQLVGPWVDEFCRSWDSVRQNREGQRRDVVIDLKGVTVISVAGKDALRAMADQGAHFVCGGVYVQHLMQDLEGRHKSSCP